MLFSLAKRIARIIHSVHLLPNPHGMRMPSRRQAWCSLRSRSDRSDHSRLDGWILLMRTLQLCSAHACLIASMTLRSQSHISLYLPTRAIVTSCFGWRMLCTLFSQSLISNFSIESESFSATILCSHCLAKLIGT